MKTDESTVSKFRLCKESLRPPDLVPVEDHVSDHTYFVPINLLSLHLFSFARCCRRFLHLPVSMGVVVLRIQL